MLDLTESIAPRSDQMNAEDLLSGPRTFTIRDVRQGKSAEQPIDIVLDEFPAARPFKPSKTVRRILVAAWGKDASEYVGRRMTLYRDPTVRFGGQDVGGIRVSHLSHIDKPLTVALTVTRGKRAPHTVQPLAASPSAPKTAEVQPVTDQQLRRMRELFEEKGIDGGPARLAFVSNALGRDVESATALSRDEAAGVINALTTHEDPPPVPEGQEALLGGES